VIVNEKRNPAAAGPVLRPDGREDAGLRSLRATRGFLPHAEGSALMEMGATRVICAVSVEEKVPPFLKGTGQGWVTAEYAMLPRATHTRNQREGAGKIQGRSQEIQRMVGRALRAVVDTAALGERTLTVDCDVLSADGGTRTASVNGAFLALVDALRLMRERKLLRTLPVEDFIGAVSVGIVDSRLMVDLSYAEDSQADVDLTLVMTGGGALVEVQGGGEGTTFSREDLSRMVDAGAQAVQKVVAWQKEMLGPLR
jgi:ribonuclease PH